MPTKNECLLFQVDPGAILVNILRLPQPASGVYIQKYTCVLLSPYKMLAAAVFRGDSIEVDVS